MESTYTGSIDTIRAYLRATSSLEGSRHYCLALACLESAYIVLNGTRMVGKNNAGCACPPPFYSTARDVYGPFLQESPTCLPQYPSLKS